MTLKNINIKDWKFNCKTDSPSNPITIGTLLGSLVLNMRTWSFSHRSHLSGNPTDNPTTVPPMQKPANRKSIILFILTFPWEIVVSVDWVSTASIRVHRTPNKGVKNLKISEQCEDLRWDFIPTLTKCFECSGNSFIIVFKTHISACSKKLSSWAHPRWEKLP